MGERYTTQLDTWFSIFSEPIKFIIFICVDSLIKARQTTDESAREIQISYGFMRSEPKG